MPVELVEDEGGTVSLPGDSTVPLVEEKPKKKAKKKLIGDSDLTHAALKIPKPKKEKKPPKPKLAMDLRSVFERRLLELDTATLIKPWMHTKAIRLVTTVSELESWSARILADKSRYRPCPRTGEMMPVVAVDTENYGVHETSGLDLRIINGESQVAIAGVCLAADSSECLYVPLDHEDGNNVPREPVRAILQHLFDSSLLVFFNSKYDREVLRFTLDLKLRPYPYFEDVQILHFLLDPKSEVEEEVSSFTSDGLKALSLRELGIHQIELDELAKVKAQVVNPHTGKKSYRMLLAPFNWIPTQHAVLYAAPDALTTWMLWDKMRDEARTMKLVHKVDHELADTLAWVERQRPLIDVPALQKTISWHQEKMNGYKKTLATMAGRDDFNPGSTGQLAHVLFEVMKFPVIKKSEKTGAASTDESVIEELQRRDKDHPFLKALMSFRSYASLHPGNLRYDVRDHSARLFFKQCTVAGGRLAAMGGDHMIDGGFGLNPQAIKSVGGNHMITARRLKLEDLPDLGATFDPRQVPEMPKDEIHPSCFKDGKLAVENVIANHVARYCGEWWSLSKSETTITLDDGTVIGLDAPAKVDANEVINLRGLFIAPEGYTYFVTDYSNIEMRVAANISKEPKFIEEFLHGSGDFHTLTAKAIFPEFSDPKVDKGTKKKLRGIAKIINFALLYGGTEYTIYENLKAEDPTMTRERAKAMVDKYWDSVPVFQEWAQGMQQVAKDTLTCKTKSGRRVDFRSAMKALRITEPTEEGRKAYRKYWDLRKKSEDMKAKGNVEEARTLLAKADAIMFDKSTGAANVGEYNRFVGKVQRVSVNVPLQGLAGDFMRIALTEIRQWAERAGLGYILLVHATVHDEIDYSIKNEYVPYVLPRLVRLMKLRDLHKKMNWPVPIETDTEYGRSWDVKEHLTGDDGHNPAGYTKVPGLEKYVPAMFDRQMVKTLALALCSTSAEDRAEAREFLKATVHPRCHVNIPKLEGMEPKDAVQAMISILQLHEYWLIDQAEAGADDDETLADYQQRMGLTPEVSSPDVVFHDEPAPVDIVVPHESTFEDEEEAEAEVEVPPTMGIPVPAFEAVAEVQVSTPSAATEVIHVEETAVAVMEPEPEIEPVRVLGPAMRPKMIDGVYVLRRDTQERDLVTMKTDLGWGRKTLDIVFKGQFQTLRNVESTVIPESYLEMESIRGED